MYKSKLQEYCQSKAWHLPVYSTTKEGLDHCPQFMATVTVNGSIFSTPDLSKSSKEAQNKVAKLAYESLTGSWDGVSMLPATPASSAYQQPKTTETSHGASMGGLISPRNDKNFKEMAHLYKNQLQIYAQKRNLPLPVYSYEREGPPHACRFRSKVTLEQKTYESPEYFSTVKDAENAAAKAALMALSLSDGIQEEDPTVFKNLLQELAQKEYSFLPEYNTTWTGSSRMQMFVSTVEINEESFTGEEAKTKKLAEMNAAKVAYTSLKERQAKQKSEPYCSGSQEKDASKLSSLQLRVVMPELPQRNCPDPKLSFNKSNGAPQKDTGSEPVKVSFNFAQDGISPESQCSISDPVQPTPLFDPITNTEPWAEPNMSSSQKFVKIFPRMPNMTFPPGTTIYHENGKWVAVTAKPVQGNE